MNAKAVARLGLWPVRCGVPRRMAQVTTTAGVRSWLWPWAAGARPDPRRDRAACPCGVRVAARHVEAKVRGAKPRWRCCGRGRGGRSTVRCTARATGGKVLRACGCACETCGVQLHGTACKCVRACPPVQAPVSMGAARRPGKQAWEKAWKKAGLWGLTEGSTPEGHAVQVGVSWPG